MRLCSLLRDRCLLVCGSGEEDAGLEVPTPECLRSCAGCGARGLCLDGEVCTAFLLVLLSCPPGIAGVGRAISEVLASTCRPLTPVDFSQALPGREGAVELRLGRRP